MRRTLHPVKSRLSQTDLDNQSNASVGKGVAEWDFCFHFVGYGCQTVFQKVLPQVANSLTPDRCTDQAIRFKFRVGFICEIPTGVLANFSIRSLSFYLWTVSQLQQLI